MCERERGFCDLSIFRSHWKWFRFGYRYLLSSHGIEWHNSFYKLVPKVFYLLYLGRIQIESIISLKIYDLRDAFNQECESLHKI